MTGTIKLIDINFMMVVTRLQTFDVVAVVVVVVVIAIIAVLLLVQDMFSATSMVACEFSVHVTLNCAKEAIASLANNMLTAASLWINSSVRGRASDMI